MQTLPSYLEGAWRTGVGDGVPVADAVPTR